MITEDSSPALSPEIDRIINSGRMADVAAGSAKPVFAASVLSSVLLWISFTPVDFAPAAWVALVPLCLLIRLRLLPRYSMRTLMVVGFVSSLITLQWLRLGHVAMYGALVALSFYIAFYLPVFVATARALVRAQCPMWLAVPITWTALEFIRAHLMTGFSWYYLGHSQYQWTSLVQISDITGAYGVSFLVALGGAALAECIPGAWLLRMRLASTVDDVKTLKTSQRGIAVACAVGAVAAACLYGEFRMLPADIVTDGPIVAVAQGNFEPLVNRNGSKLTRMWMDHHLLSRTAAGLRPDLIVWPETMFPEPDVIIGDGVSDRDLYGLLQLPGNVSNSAAAEQIVTRWRQQRARALLTDLSHETGTALMIGLLTEVHRPDAHERYNSAAFISPTEGYAGRYDKMHRVMFGEYIPLKEVMPWLAGFTPWGEGFGINEGAGPSVFHHASASFAPVICFEDTVPHLVRDVVNTKNAAGKQPDVLINMTNDAWFRGSSELDQHLITATFRCIETRRPMIRAVNSGISAFIDSSGRVRQPEHMLIMREDTAGVIADFQRVDSMIDPETGERYRMCSAILSGQVPLDGRESLYLRFGDWFAILCTGLTTLGLFVARMKRRPSGDDGEPAESTTLSQAAA